MLPVHYVRMQLDFCHIVYKRLSIPGFYGQDASVVHHDPITKVNVVSCLGCHLFHYCDYPNSLKTV